MRKIVIAPDSFKGSLSAGEVARCCGDAISGLLPGCETMELPLADGGEGTVDAVASSFGGEMMECCVSGPLGESVTARYLKRGDVALMEMAQASGLCLVSESQRDPMLATTKGVGEMISDALAHGCRKIIMGIGGSATTDGGMGMLSALGCRFYDKEGRELDGRGIDLQNVATIDISRMDERLAGVSFVVACDVDNPLYGANGAAYVFSPQKGADPDMVIALDKGLRNYARVMDSVMKHNFSEEPGAGAAGGLGYAMMGVLGARRESGIDVVLDAIGFDDKISDADLIITGEGSIDRQSLMGKTVSGVLKRAEEKNIPVIAIAGIVKDRDLLEKAGFAGVYQITPGSMSLKEAMKPGNSRENIRRTISEIVRSMSE